MANETVLAGNPDALAITGEDKIFFNSGDMRLILVGLPPAIIPPPAPITGSFAFTGEVPTRGVGLLTTGQQPVVRIHEIVPAVIGAIQLSTLSPQILEKPPIKAAPETTALSISSDAATLPIARPTSGSIALSGLAATIADLSTVIIPPNRDKTGEEFGDIAPTLITSSFAPTLSFEFVGGKPGDGTLILNPDATTDSLNRYNICSRTGYRMRPNTLIKDAYGEFVRPESADTRHPQERVKSQPESQRGALRPEPIGDETFIDSDDPVLAEDL